jgi:hypothetical protein
MNWNANEFVWLDWVVLVVGILGLATPHSRHGGRRFGQQACRYDGQYRRRLCPDGEGRPSCRHQGHRHHWLHLRFGDEVDAITFTPAYRKQIRESWSVGDIIASLGVVACCVAFYIYFF